MNQLKEKSTTLHKEKMNRSASRTLNLLGIILLMRTEKLRAKKPSGTEKNINLLKLCSDMYFHDDRTGYIVGDSSTTGVLLKVVSAINIQPSTNIASQWKYQTLKDGFNITANSNINPLNVVAFSNRYNGLVAGSYASGFTNTSTYPYVRLLHDEGDMFSTYFYYDRLGRLVVSQNTKQFNKTPIAYSYTTYDALGRISEVGEKSENANGHKFKNIFGDTVNIFFNPRVVNDDSLTTWLASTGTRKEVTHTYYDTIQYSDIPVVQQNLRKRVSSTTYEDVDDNNRLTYNCASHFSYDIHGNVNTLIQDDSVSVAGQRFKRIDYTYDLVSGNVNQVSYQTGKPDRFYHRYMYDSDNRITQVHTSKDSILWDNDAKYFYYAHGPLARAEYGDNHVQGIDYAYTLQGWIKAVNSNLLKVNNDMGHDGDTTKVNRSFAHDAYGYSLNYFNKDYTPIGTLASTDSAIATLAGSDILKARHDLFNGNISSMVTSITAPTAYTKTTGTPVPLPQGTAYRYDQLNRIVEMQAYKNINTSTNVWGSGSTYAGSYQNKFTYNENSSLLTALAKNDTGGVIDKQIYHHQTVGGRQLSNRTYAITDSASITSGEDLLNQVAYDNDADSVNIKNNYTYTEIGERKTNKQDSVSLISWTVYGKLKEVTHQTGCRKSDVEFNYDVNGKRISKIVKPRDGSGLRPSNEWITTQYVRDAQGNIMSVYTNNPNLGSFAQTERPIYGSSEIGAETTSLEMIGATVPTDTAVRYLGYKHYTGSNHLSNTLVTFTDKKIPRGSGTTLYNYEPEIIGANDYAPFGGLLTERTFNKNAYPNSFNGKRDDKELHIQDYGARPYEPWTRELDWQYDPLSSKYPWLSPYQFAANNPIYYIDVDGMYPDPPSGHRRRKPILSNSFTGGGLVSLFGGYRGKYLKNSSLDLVSTATSRANNTTNATSGDINGNPNETRSKAFDRPNKPEDNSNPLELVKHPSGNYSENDEQIAKPQFNKGTIAIDFNPGVDDKGNSFKGTLEIGIIGKDGTINVLQKIETDTKTTLKADFDLKPGETISIKNTAGDTGGWKAKATRDTEPKKETKKEGE